MVSLSRHVNGGQAVLGEEEEKQVVTKAFGDRTQQFRAMTPTALSASSLHGAWCGSQVPTGLGAHTGL